MNSFSYRKLYPGKMAQIFQIGLKSSHILSQGRQNIYKTFSWIKSPKFLQTKTFSTNKII